MEEMWGRSFPILLVHLPPSERRSGGWTSGMGNERHVCLLGREVSRSTFLGLACRSHSSCFTPFLTPVPLRVTTEGSREEWVGSEGNMTRKSGETRHGQNTQPRPVP